MNPSHIPPDNLLHLLIERHKQQQLRQMAHIKHIIGTIGVIASVNYISIVESLENRSSYLLEISLTCFMLAMIITGCAYAILANLVMNKRTLQEITWKPRRNLILLFLTGMILATYGLLLLAFYVHSVVVAILILTLFMCGIVFRDFSRRYWVQLD